MVKDAFTFVLLILGIVSLVVGIWGIDLAAKLIGSVTESRVAFWNFVLFAALIGAGGISIGVAVANRYPNGYT